MESESSRQETPSFSSSELGGRPFRKFGMDLTDDSISSPKEEEERQPTLRIKLELSEVGDRNTPRLPLCEYSQSGSSSGRPEGSQLYGIF